MALWGLVSTLTGVAHNFVGVVLTRFFLGIFESAFFPVSKLQLVNVPHMSSWKNREPCFSFRDGTNAMNLVYGLQSSHAVVR